MSELHPNFIQGYFHGTRAQLQIGDAIVPGSPSNYGDRRAKFAYVSSNLNVAIWGAELAVGDGTPRIYVVEALGAIEDDPNVTDKKFPGNPTRSMRSRDGFRIVGEVVGWRRHDNAEVREARERVDAALAAGVPIFDE